MDASQARHYNAHAQSTDTFGRVLCSVRDHHFIVDGPVQNGAPGEGVTPGELFLGSVASCGVELLQLIAREQNAPLSAVRVAISGTLDRSRPARSDVTVFNSVRLDFHLHGVAQEQADTLIESFKRR
jgi:organic hydroperoxide reductase OsmC/OhrA